MKVGVVMGGAYIESTNGLFIILSLAAKCLHLFIDLPMSNKAEVSVSSLLENQTMNADCLSVGDVSD